jgi:hypothetical protein
MVFLAREGDSDFSHHACSSSLNCKVFPRALARVSPWLSFGASVVIRTRLPKGINMHEVEAPQ